MSSDRDTTRIVRAWLDEGVTALPDHVLDAVLDQLPDTHQRRATWWPARRIPLMNNIAKFGLAAVVVVAALLGYSYLVAPNVGGPSLGDPTPTPTPTAIQRLGNAPLDPGPVEATGFGESGLVTLRFTVPDGWTGFSGVGVLPSTGTEAPDGMGIGFGEVNAGMFADPCQWNDAVPEVPVGPTVDDLVNAFAEQTAYMASAPVDVSLGGYSGKRVDLQLPSDVASCDAGEFYPWVGSLFAQGPDNRWDVWILDVEGERIVVLGTHFPGTSQEDQAEQQAIIDSIVIER